MNNCIYKFGGAALANAAGYKNAVHIIQSEGLSKSKRVWVVASASGKTTNMLEGVIEVLEYAQKRDAKIAAIVNHHIQILNDLAIAEESREEFRALVQELYSTAEMAQVHAIDKSYDSVIAFGERLSVCVFILALRELKVEVRGIDAKKTIRTNSTFRSAEIHWEETEQNIQILHSTYPETAVWICEGFVGGDSLGNTTTLGREGSDFSAAILAYCLQAESATIWKDVPGVLNADPRRIPEAVFLPQLTYSTALKMAFYGAQIIHPKSIAPLKAKGIPLYVRPYNNPESMGTCIQSDSNFAFIPPLIIVRDKQVYLELSTKNFNFFTPSELENVFSILSKYGTRLSKYQNKSTHLQLVIEEDKFNFRTMMQELNQMYSVVSEMGLELMTVLHAQEDFIFQIRKQHKIKWESNEAGTVQLVY